MIQAVNNPTTIIGIVTAYAVGYYVVSFLFYRHANRPDYKGLWRKNSLVDIGSSILWGAVAIVFIASLLDLIIRNALPLGYLLVYFALWTLLFAFMYNIVNWHFPGFIHGLEDGWASELQCLTLSASAMTGGPSTVARAGNTVAEAVVSIQSVLGMLMVVVFIAKAVAAVSSR